MIKSPLPGQKGPLSYLRHRAHCTLKGALGMDVYFKPKINTRGDGFIITAPHDIRERTWYNLQLLDGLYVADREGLSGTQISVWPIEPYELRFVYSLTVTCLYLAALNAEIDVVWKTPVEDHLEAFVELVELSKSRDLEQLTVNEIQPMIELWLQKKSVNVLKHIAENRFSRINRFNIAHIEWMLQEANKALGRLTFTPTVNKEIVRTGTGAITAQQTIDNGLIEARRSRSMQTGRQKACLDELKKFETGWAYNEFTRLDWLALIKFFNEQYKLAENEYDAGLARRIEEAMQVIYITTPPNPASKPRK